MIQSLPFIYLLENICGLILCYKYDKICYKYHKKNQNLIFLKDINV